MAVIVPEMSDFGSGTSLWRVSRHGRRSRLVYEARMQPDFFIPPLVGRYFVEHKLKNERLMTFQRIECAARTRLMIDEADKAGVVVDMENDRVC